MATLAIISTAFEIVHKMGDFRKPSVSAASAPEIGVTGGAAQSCRARRTRAGHPGLPVNGCALSPFTHVPREIRIRQRFLKSLQQH